MNLLSFFDFSKFFKSRADRRKYERMHVMEVLYLDFKSNQPPLQGTGEAQDISLSGTRFKTEQKIPKGISLELKLRFAAGSTTTDSLTTQGVVIDCSRNFRRKHYHVRCQFAEFNSTQIKQLEIFFQWWKERADKYIHFRYGDTA